MQVFDEMDLDILKEIGNIGAGNAATALSAMLDITVDIGVSKCALIPFSQIADVLSGPETIVLGILVQLEGDMEGFILLAMELPHAAKTMKILMNTEVDPPADDPEAALEMLEPLKEVGNILASAYISAITSMTNLRISPTVPEMTVDMAMAIMNVPALVYGEVSESALMLETSFQGLQESMDGHFFLMPTVQTYDKLRKALLGC